MSHRSPEEHLQMNRVAWDAAHRAWFESSHAPDWHEKYRNGDTDFDETEIDLIGDVSGLDILQLSCAGDASAAFSFAVLGAHVTACDFSPVAIEIARENARKTGLDVRFVVDDSQRLATIEDEQFDLVHADYNLCYYEDLATACWNWHRVLRPGGRLFLHEHHPLTSWCLERDDEIDAWRVRQSYDDRRPEYYRAEESEILRLGDPELMAVEFPHTMADILNAVFESGLIAKTFLERTGESPQGTACGVLPSDFFLVARKPG